MRQKRFTPFCPWFLCLALSVVGCGKDHNTGLDAHITRGVPNGTSLKKGAERHALAGLWRSQCQRRSQNSTKTEARFFDDRSLILTFYFSDNHCRRPDFQSVLVLRSLPVAGRDEQEWKLEAGASQIQDVLLAPNSERTTRSMQNNRSCETPDWSMNRAQSVLGTDCFQRKLEFGTFRFLRGVDPNGLQIFYPNDEYGIWLNKRS